MTAPAMRQSTTMNMEMQDGVDRKCTTVVVDRHWPDSNMQNRIGPDQLVSACNLHAMQNAAGDGLSGLSFAITVEGLGNFHHSPAIGEQPPNGAFRLARKKSTDRPPMLLADGCIMQLERALAGQSRTAMMRAARGAGAI